MPQGRGAPGNDPGWVKGPLRALALTALRGERAGRDTGRSYRPRGSSRPTGGCPRLPPVGSSRAYPQMFPHTRPEGARIGTLGHHCGLPARRGSRPQKRKNPRETPGKPRIREGQSGEAPVGVEPTMADLQSAALATWLRRHDWCVAAGWPHG